MTRRIVACLSACLMPIAAAAQTGSGTTGQTQGPMIVERVHSGFLVAPDFKITEVDKETSGLAGGNAGWVVDDVLFVGGGGYWLANQASDRKMAYGGFVVQWLPRRERTIGFSVKTLIGGGRATLGATIPRFIAMPEITNGPRPGSVRGSIVNTRVRYDENFFVAEPEADVVFRLTHRLRLTAGIGYRLTSVDRRGFNDDGRLRGAVGSVGLQIVTGS